ncbi:MAG TPA: hypothetical protein VFV38_11350 [Ktedonobacteraceae bacterium]|nr:hypothetical protein [Ktedonobacteraceae bacterium]
MQLLLLKVDEEHQNTLQQIPQKAPLSYTPGMLGAMLCCILLVAWLYLWPWHFNLALLDLHTHSWEVISAQTLLIFFLCCVSSLACSSLNYRSSGRNTLAQQNTTEAIQWLLRIFLSTLLVLAALLFLLKSLRGHPWSAPLIAFLPVLALLYFYPYLLNLAWVRYQVRSYLQRRRPLVATRLVDLSPTQPGQVNEEVVDASLLDLNR